MNIKSLIPIAILQTSFAFGVQAQLLAPGPEAAKLNALQQRLALIIDGWDAQWSRITYDDVPFDDIYHLVKSLQPECLVMDLNGAKYPAEGLYYTDIKSYEMGATAYVCRCKKNAFSGMPSNQLLLVLENRFPYCSGERYR